MLHHLDIPHDARLMSVSASIDPLDGAMIWTVQYKALPGSATPTMAPPAAFTGTRSRSVSVGQDIPRTLSQLSLARATLPHRAESPRTSYQQPGSPMTLGARDAPFPTSLPPRIDIPSSQTFPMLSTLGSGQSTMSHYLLRCFPLKCIVQTYAWGKIGLDSAVARIAFAEGALQDDIGLEESTPYAELWMGTHPSGPSMVVLNQPWKTITPLSEWLKLNPELAGSKASAASVRPPMLV